ncbi:hypothetical protein N8H10_17690, partial [Curtobacterium flaccumfaciens pv. poinsettiae]|uniref:hypothetical protein n=1 Tax=Curtobacterium poinsettiae TaxID=159612 RepID=UPI0021C8D66F
WVVSPGKVPVADDPPVFPVPVVPPLVPLLALSPVNTVPVVPATLSPKAIGCYQLRSDGSVCWRWIRRQRQRSVLLQRAVIDENLVSGGVHGTGWS